MTDRLPIQQLLQTLYAARVAGELEPLCRTFADYASFQIAGSSEGRPISINALGVAQFRPWLSILIKTFKISDYKILSTIIDAPKAAVQWRCTIHSKITGVAVPTELVDLIEVRDGRVASYIEFFVPC